MATEAEVQAALFAARERRKSLAGLPDQAKTHFIYGGTAMATTIAADQFPDRTRLCTFQTRIRATAGAGANNGLIFEIGDSTAGVALWIAGQTINFHAGEAGTVTGVNVQLDLSRNMEIGEEFEIMIAVRNDGLAGMWFPMTHDFVKSQASDTDFGTTDAWASSSAGAFAQAVNGTTPADVTQSGAPSGFDVIKPLSVYLGSAPRGFF